MAPLLIRHSLPIEPKAFPIWGARADYPEKIRVTIPEGPKQHDTGVVVAMTARALDRLLVDPQDACSFIEIHRSNLRLETHDKRGREDPKFVRDADARMIEAKFLLRGSYEANCLVALMNALGEHVALAVFVEAWVMNFAELGSMIFKRESDR